MIYDIDLANAIKQNLYLLFLEIDQVINVKYSNNLFTKINH